MYPGGPKSGLKVLERHFLNYDTYYAPSTYHMYYNMYSKSLVYVQGKLK